jgi:beta-lactamase class A
MVTNTVMIRENIQNMPALWKWVTGLILAVFLGYLMGRYCGISSTLVDVKSVKNSQFINPTVSSNIEKHFIINFKPLKDEYLRIQSDYRQKTYVYFAYLPNAAWVGIGEKELFYAASTIKVPLAMSIYQSIESGILSPTMKYSIQDADLNNGFGDLYKKGVDNELTIDVLVKLMLEESDNTAMLALRSVNDSAGIGDPFIRVYQAMGWDTDLLNQNRDYVLINLKTLANMFLSLYNGTYVNIDHSNDILEHLANSQFNDKMVAGVPSPIPVAHKIGVAQDLKTYSDCGIVYAPKRHYLLCLGSIGANESDANAFMKRISEATYRYVTNN